MLAIPHEREVIVRKPVEERFGLGNDLIAERRRVALQLGADLAHLLQHRLPVGDHDAHVAEHAQDARTKLTALHRVDDAVDLDMHQRFTRPALRRRAADELQPLPLRVAAHSDDRMRDEMQRQPVSLHLHLQRVDEERHVVVDDLHDRMR